MLTSTIVGIFASQSNIDPLLTELNNLGFNKEHISVLCKEKPVSSIRTYSTAIYPETIRIRDTYPEIDYVGDRQQDPLWRKIIAEESEHYEIQPSLADTHSVKEKSPTAMVKGATVGGAVGLLVGLISLMVPGLGLVLAGGPLAAAIAAGASGAAVGIATGTLIGLLKDEGIPQERAEFYYQHLEKGNLLILLHVKHEMELTQTSLKEILARFHPITIDTF